MMPGEQNCVQPAIRNCIKAFYSEIFQKTLIRRVADEVALF